MANIAKVSKLSKIKIEDLVNITQYLDDLNLTNKQRMFCWVWFFNGHDVVEAVKLAGYEVGNSRHNKITSGKETEEDLIKNYGIVGYENLSKPSIKEALRRISDQELDITKIKLKNGLMNILQTMAAYNMSDFIDDNGRLKVPLAQIPPELQCCIKNIKTRRYGKFGEIKIQEVELIDRTWAIEKLTKIAEVISDIPRAEGKKMNDEDKGNLQKFFLQRNDLVEVESVK